MQESCPREVLQIPEAVALVQSLLDEGQWQGQGRRGQVAQGLPQRPHLSTRREQPWAIMGVGNVGLVLQRHV